MANKESTPPSNAASSRVPRCGPLRAQAMADCRNPRACFGDLPMVTLELPPELDKIPGIYTMATRYLEAFEGIPGFKHFPGPELAAYHVAFKRYNPEYTKMQATAVLHKYLGLPDAWAVEAALRERTCTYMQQDGHVPTRRHMNSILSGYLRSHTSAL